MKARKMLASTLVVSIVLAVLVVPGGAQRPEPLQPASVTSAVGTAFSYQGQLKKDGGLVNGTCDFEFSLWNQVGTGTPPTGGTQIGGTQSKSGVTVTDGLFTVQLDFGSTAFSGEARYLQTGVKCTGDSIFNTLSPRQTLFATPYALGLNPGAVISDTTAHDAFPILTIRQNFTDLLSSGSPDMPYSTTGGGTAAVYINSNAGYSLYSVNSSTGSAIRGSSDSGTGVRGTTLTGNGVFGGADTGYAGYFMANTGYAGYFSGNVHVNGTFSKSAGSFKIDHPLDPENQYLSHSFVESPDMMNVYNGNITTDANGEAIVLLPDYFEALNRDFRYQLTVIGEFAQAIIAEEIQDNRFTIKTDKPNIKVSWQVTGIRHDPYAEQNRIPVEEDKPLNERGTYLYPQGYGMPVTMTVNYVVPDLVK
jgi:hypothetical protein